MPVTTGSHSNNEILIYNKLKEAGFNTAAICGILANIFVESGFNPQNLQNSYEKELGYTDDTYTSAVDRGEYKNFVNDSAGYGLCQWTHSSRKRKLRLHASDNKKSIGDLYMQINFMIQELQTYSSTWETLNGVSNDSEGAYKAAKVFCLEYENPAGAEYAAEARANGAKTAYWDYYSVIDDTASSPANTGKDIVSEARSKIDTDITFTDSAKLLYEACLGAGVTIPDLSAADYYKKYSVASTARKVDISQIAPGDLLFYDNNTDVAIANGNGGRIYVSEGKAIEVDDIGSPSAILRIIPSLSTVSIYTSINSTKTSDSDSSYNMYDPYAMKISHNLARVQSVGFDYGYLIDLDHGGEFKFYVPEFTEQAGANYSSVELKGRSVTVQAYKDTKSRTVTVSLDLYAGVGLYTASDSEDGPATIDRLHRDAYFLKSLEYPDYSNVITRPPSTVLLILGNSFELTGVVSGVSVEHLKPVDEQNRSMYLKVSFTVTQTAANPIDYRDIRSGKHTLTGEVTILDATWQSPSDPPEDPSKSPRNPGESAVPVIGAGNSIWSPKRMELM